MSRRVTIMLDDNLIKSGGIDYIISYIYEKIIVPPPYKPEFDKIKNSEDVTKEDWNVLWCASRYLRHLSDFVEISDDIWNLDFLNGHYDEEGVTCMINPDYNKLTEERYIIFIDMHS